MQYYWNSYYFPKLTEANSTSDPKVERVRSILRIWSILPKHK